MNSSRKGMVSVESLLLIAVGALILLGLKQYWNARLAPQTEKVVAVVLGQEEELRTPISRFEVNRPTTRPKLVNNPEPYSALDNLIYGFLNRTPDLPVDFFAGLGDHILFGFGQDLRDLLGIGGVDLNSDQYRYGAWTGIAADLATGVKALWNLAKNPKAFLSIFKKAPIRGAAFFDDLATSATRNAGSTKLVLGKWNKTGQSYQKVAAHYKATYFKLDNWRELSGKLSRAELWKINEAFLDQQIKAGKQIIMSHNPAKATGFFADEVAYLRSLGYKFVQDGWVWKAVKS